MRRLGLRIKLFMAFGIVLLPMLVMLIVTFQTSLGWRESLILESQRLTADAVAVQVDEAFDAAIGFAWAIANDPLTQTLDPSRLDLHLKQLMERHPYYQELNIFDAQGLNRGYGHLSQSPEPRVNVATRLYFQSVMATNFPVISQVIELTRPAGAIGIIAAVPIRKGENVIGVVTVVMTAEQLAKRYEETRLLPGQAIVLADRTAHLAFHSLRRKLSLPESAAFEKLQPLRTALAGISTTVGEFTDPVTNDRRLGVFVPTLRHHWAIGVTIPPSIALTPVYGLLRQQLGTFVGMLILSAILAYVIARYFVKPFLRLDEAAQALGRGDLTRRVDIHTGDEIEQLGISFNKMAAQIQERDNSLREREARIRRLMESNIIALEEHSLQLLAAKERAELANRAKNEFLGKMSHELRTPLNAVLGFAQIMKRGKSLTADQTRGLKMISDSGWHLLTLINDLLDVSNIESGKLELHLRVTNLSAFLRAIAETIRVKAQEKGLLFIYDVPAELPHAVEIDDHRVRQVILNLLGNAVKFTDHGQVSLRVRNLDHADRQIRLRIEVQDSGIGIAEEKRDAIFRPFEQAGDLQYRFGGSGLGLTISRQIVRLMGSDIHVESKIGEGSLFWFELDVREADTQITAPSSENAATVYRGSQKKVLVVDDIPANRAVMIDALSVHGFELFEAENGRDALEKAQILHPDLILMDIVMPEMDGLEATLRIRQLPAVKNVAIIAISASASSQDQAKSLAAGADAFLTKPVNIDILLKQIGKLLRVKRDHEQPEARN